MKRPLGDFSRISLQSVEVANAYQAHALDHIRESFSAEEEREPGRLDITGETSFGDFVTALTEANERGERDQFEAHIAAQLAQMQQQIQAQQQAQAQQGQPQPTQGAQ